MRVKLWLAGLAVVLASCSSQPGGAAPASPSFELAVHPESGLAVIPLTVSHGDKTFSFRVEVASTPAQQARGLMFRQRMGANEGMIFPFNPPRGAAFWMKNTVIPLDIIFIGTDHKILNIAANAVPYSEQPLPSAGTAAAVLELNGGRTAELGIVAGDKVDW
jgi:uncharacterized membrane protein (UPF0127 family)